MFVTHKQAEIPFGSYFGDGNAQHWQYVEQTLHCPWFYVGLARQSGKETMISMLLIPSVHAFEQLLKEQGKDMWIKEVQLVAPGYLNGSDRWEMRRMLELYEVIGEQGDSCSYVYGLEGGEFFSERSQVNKKFLSSTRVVFSAAKHLRS